MQWALWLALLAALSPTLHDLARHWVAHSWARYSLGFVPLFVWVLATDARRSPRRIPGLVLIGASVLGQILASLASFPAAARPLAPTAILGAVLFTGIASPRAAVLAFWLVPVPNVLIERLGGGALAAQLAGGAAKGASVLGATVVASEGALRTAASHIVVPAQWGGLLLLVQLAGLAWYVGIRRGLAARPTAIALLATAALAGPLQLVFLTAAAAALSLGHAGLGAFVIDPVSWVAPLGVALVLAERRRAGANA
ncbi:MAG: hypothetical protein ACE5FL_05460 [Myxococcota bacterium]